MNHWLRLIWIILVALLPQAAEAPVSGQIIFLCANERTDLVLNAGVPPGAFDYGDLYSYMPEQAQPFRLTTWGFNRAPVLSPNGQMLAYQSVPENIVEIAEAAEYFFDYDRDALSNIWSMDLTTLQANRIADQSGDGQLRSQPVWSPNSQQIAWRERSASDALNQKILAYNLETADSQVWLEGRGGGCFDGGIIHVQPLNGWGSHIALEYWPCKAAMPPSVLFYTLAGIDLSVEITLPDRVYDYDRTRTWTWAKRGDKWVYVIELPENWLLIDPETDEQFILSEPPLLQTVSGEGLRLRVAGGLWTVIQTDGSESSLPDTASEVVLSPDGSTVAYLDGGTAYLWHDGIAEPLLPTALRDWQILSLAWSPMLWSADGGFENRG